MTKAEVKKLGRYPEEFLEGLVDSEPSIYDSTAVKLKWRCEKHGEYTQTIGAHLISLGCPTCRRSKAAHDRYEGKGLIPVSSLPYDVVTDKEFVRASDFIIRKCYKHGEWRQQVHNALKGAGCKKCYEEKRGLYTQQALREKNPFTEEFIRDVFQEDREAVLKGLIRVHEKARFVCTKHGVYRQIIRDHMRGCGCQKCVEGQWRSKREVGIQDWLQKLGYKVEHNVRILPIDGKLYEVDLLIDGELAVEFNGLFWHHSGPEGKRKDYHYNKTKAANSIGMKLLHFWEFEEEELIKEQILKHLQGKDKPKSAWIDLDKHPQFFKEGFVEENIIAWVSPKKTKFCRANTKLTVRDFKALNLSVEDAIREGIYPCYSSGIIKI